MPSFAVILAAAGKSSRFNDQHYKKPFAPLAGKAMWLHAAEKVLARNDVKQVIIVLAPEDVEDFRAKFGANIAILGIEVAQGGAERADSVQNALEKVNENIDYVAIHDAARPCIVDEWIDRVFKAAQDSGAAILATPVTGTLKRSRSGKTIDETVPRDHLWQAQTPQVFKKQILIEAYAKRGSLQATDDAQVVEAAGHKVSIVNGSAMNIKVTTKEDLRIAEQMLKALPKPKLKGTGNPFANDDMWR
ncbi:MAG: 2-C-methyl-D-erythritol 4-phosphate cytidylyltransferase [Planctomycetales bacterium]|nr:2-C-methyl-D-erythritol 4-phosphate cytidylyltransferase [Planctomycetales bacterium]